MVDIGRLIDISSNNHGNGKPPGQGGTPIDWSAVAGAGVTAVFVKATEGTSYVNPWLQADMLGARNAGLATCAYHFARMTDPVAEAQFFLRTAGSYARCLDYETNTNATWARTFLLTLGLPQSELITYGSLSTFHSFYAQLPSMAWVAAYGQGYPGWGVCWQFTDAATIAGIPGLVDENGWYGDETQYELLFQLINPPVPEPLPDMGEEVMSAITVTEDGVEKVKVYCVGAGNSPGHLLEFTRQPGTQTNSVIDVTNEIGLSANNGGPYTVAGPA